MVGDGTTASHYTPIQVALAVQDVSLDYYHSFFLQSPPPTISGHPLSGSVHMGDVASLSVTASSPIPVTYQWYRGSSGDTSQPIATATSPTYVTPALTTATSYWVRVTNAIGSVNSQTAILTIVAADFDADGMPDSWESAQGLDPASSSGPDGPLGDPDGDGLPNLLEYACGLAPRIASASPISVGIATHPTTGAKHLVVLYRHLLSPGALTYTLQTSPNLSDWAAPASSPEVLSTTPNGDGVTETVTVRINPALDLPPVFVRLQITP
jgi:hypothetical protein